MLRRCALPLLPTLAIAAIAVTGCGGSSNKSSSSTSSAAPASTSSGTSTGAGTSTSGGASTSGLSTSTPLNSSLAQRLFKQEGVTHGLTPDQATKFVNCLEQKFASQGLNTFADASANASQTRNDSAACALQVKTG